jgi:hypothetical protein
MKQWKTIPADHLTVCGASRNFMSAKKQITNKKMKCCFLAFHIFSVQLSIFNSSFQGIFSKTRSVTFRNALQPPNPNLNFKIILYIWLKNIQPLLFPVLSQVKMALGLNMNNREEKSSPFNLLFNLAQFPFASFVI